jgi:hypothetical protein
MSLNEFMNLPPNYLKDNVNDVNKVNDVNLTENYNSGNIEWFTKNIKNSDNANRALKSLYKLNKTNLNDNQKDIFKHLLSLGKTFYFLGFSTSLFEKNTPDWIIPPGEFSRFANQIGLDEDNKEKHISERNQHLSIFQRFTNRFKAGGKKQNKSKKFKKSKKRHNTKRRR